MYYVHVLEKIIKIENSLLAVFGEIWPMSCTIVQGIWPDFGATLKICKNPILIGISLKLINNISICICIRKNYKNEEFSPSHFWRNLAKVPVL